MADMVLVSLTEGGAFEQWRSFSPSPGGGGSARIARCETGWGDGPSTRALFETRDLHPTPPLISFAIADAKHRRSLETAAEGRLCLPLQGRVRENVALISSGTCSCSLLWWRR